VLDPYARRVLGPPLDRVAALVDVGPVTPNRITLVGLLLGLGSAGAAATALWVPALVLWLASRLADGVDGPLARRRAARTGGAVSPAGGFLDIVADFAVYGATVVGVGIGLGGSSWPFLAVLGAYYLNGTAFLAFSSLAERSGRAMDDGRSLSFIGGLAEGTETITVHSVWMAFPSVAGPVAVVWAVVVVLGAAQRIWLGYRVLRV